MLWLLEMTAGKVVNKMGEGMVQLMFSSIPGNRGGAGALVC